MKQIHRDRVKGWLPRLGGVGGKKIESCCLMATEDRVSNFQDEKSSGNRRWGGLHHNVCHKFH